MTSAQRTLKRFRLYLDTSVYGGCFDPEFADEPRRLFDFTRAARVLVLISDVIIRELSGAPSNVREILTSLPPTAVSVVALSPEVIELRDAYVAAGIVDQRSIDDATHVALATIARADAIVSWNFRYIVHLDKIRAYNQVNLMNGYGLLPIVSPREMQIDEQE